MQRDADNRGSKRVMHVFNDTTVNNALDKPEHAGDGFLMRHGFTIVWSGWIPGMPKAPNVLRLEVPNAKGVEQAVWDEFLFNDGKQTTARVEQLSKMDLIGQAVTRAVAEIRFIVKHATSPIF